MAATRARDVIVIGASAGGVEALTAVLADLPAHLAAAVAVTLHRSPFPSWLPEVIGRRAELEIIEAKDRQPFRRGRVHVAPPDLHMRILGRTIHLDRGPKQHHTRPAIDPMFQSAANSHGPRVIGLLLTGAMNDGVTGLVHIKEQGGLCLVQDPAEAQHPSMPLNALVFNHVDAMFRLATAHQILAELVSGTSIKALLKSKLALSAQR
jgi:two-component system chemotaxis response regulator CheB